MKFIGLGQYTIYWLFPFLGPIFNYLNGFIQRNFSFTTKRDSHPFFISFLQILTNFIVGIPYIISSYYELKREKNDYDRTLKGAMGGVKKVFAKVNNKPKIKLALFVIITALILSIALPSFFIISYSSDNALVGFKKTIFLIFFNSLLTYLFLKIPIYKHQLISLVAVFVGIGLSCFNDFANLTFTDTYSFLFSNLLLSLVYSFEKWIMENKEMTPYQLLLYLGCIGIVIYIIVFTALYCIPCLPTMNFCTPKPGNESIENLSQLFNSFQATNWLLCLAYLVSFSLYLFWTLLTIYYLSPVHHCISEIISIFIFWVVNITSGNTYEKYFYLSVIGYVIILLSSLIYNELIILRFWKLDYNTKMEINKRGNMVEEGKEEMESIDTISDSIIENESEEKNRVGSA